MRFEIPEHKKLIHEMVIPIRWGDMDANGHVNNTLYFRYMETIRIEWLRSLGSKLDPNDEGPVVANAFCNFHSQLEYPGDLLTKQYVTAPGRTSIGTFVTMERSDAPGVLVASGGARMVWMDYRAGKPKPLPPWMLAVVRD